MNNGDPSQSSSRRGQPQSNSVAAWRLQKYGNVLGTPAPTKNTLPSRGSRVVGDDQSSIRDDGESRYGTSGHESSSLPGTPRTLSAASIKSYRSSASSRPREQGTPNHGPSSLRNSSTPTWETDSRYAESAAPQDQRSVYRGHAGNGDGDVYGDVQLQAQRVEQLHEILGTPSSLPVENAQPAAAYMYPASSRSTAIPNPHAYHRSDPTRGGRVQAPESASSGSARVTRRVDTGRRDEARANSRRQTPTGRI